MIDEDELIDEDERSTAPPRRRRGAVPEVGEIVWTGALRGCTWIAVLLLTDPGEIVGLSIRPLLSVPAMELQPNCWWDPEKGSFVRHSDAAEKIPWQLLEELRAELREIPWCS